ncbi:HAUS augmin-like complex subunit 6 N-terminus-domain-containing protein [Xylaria nigripes]|nr:HAUS augmin-like complex subunit 6 N-terminus-domain-containing protein [Xylaria nigripes]
MSSYKPNSALARSQSLRTNPKSTLTAPVKLTSPTTKTAEIPACTSNVNLFLTNLRLLELDLEPDWPDLKPTTLSAKDAGGGQKKRVRCVEWALYRLFSLWDSNDAQAKLQPFYPPTDQVQSINLRAALVRSLEVVKKNGVLGRDVLIRKTMLDECKGDRLEEVLAVFSSAVLKKMVAERALNSGTQHRPTISESISLESWGYKGDRTELNGLLIAHKASLRSILKNKNVARQKYRDFEELLAIKEQRIARRREQAKSIINEEATPMSNAEKSELCSMLRNNWAGNEHWLDALLLGDGAYKKSGLFNTPFDEVWDGVKTGAIADFEGQTAGLLEQLEKRVRCQQTRLQKWKAFQNSTFGRVKPRVIHDPPPKDENSDGGFDFTAHLHLDYDANYIKFDNPPSEYARLSDELKTELEGLNSTKIPDFSSLLAGMKRGPTSTAPKSVPQEELVSDLSGSEDEPEAAISQPKAEECPKSNSVRPMAIRGGAARYQIQQPRNKVSRGDRKASPIRGSPVESLAPPIQFQPEIHPVLIEPQQDLTDKNEFIVNSRQEERDKPYSALEVLECSETVSDDTCPKSPTQALADEILASMNNVSPSPVKKSRYTLSLAERTQLSMTRKQSFELEVESPQISPVEANHAQESSGQATDTDLEHGDEYEDLTARTQRSMAGFEAARHKAQQERRQSQRKSRIIPKKEGFFPQLDEEIVGDISVVEELMEDGQEDYEAVFKSRPRIANSPAPSQYGGS